MQAALQRTAPAVSGCPGFNTFCLPCERRRHSRFNTRQARCSVCVSTAAGTLHGTAGLGPISHAGRPFQHCQRRH